MAAAMSGFLLGGMLDKDLEDELEVDEKEINACAPYQAR